MTNKQNTERSVHADKQSELEEKNRKKLNKTTKAKEKGNIETKKRERKKNTKH